MTGQELINHMRESVIYDMNPPYRCEDAELLRFLNYAEVQACRRSHLIIDWTSANDSGTAATASTAGQRPLCQISLVADQAEYWLSPKVLQVKRCQLKSQTVPMLGPVSLTDLDNDISGWWGTAGTVATAGSGGYPMFFMNEPGNKITFVYAPSTTDTAYLVVSRLPLISFTASTSPEVNESYHLGLCNWAGALAFRKPKKEIYDLDAANRCEAAFISEFGPLPDAYTERIRRTMMANDQMRPVTFGG